MRKEVATVVYLLFVLVGCTAQPPRANPPLPQMNGLQEQKIGNPQAALTEHVTVEPLLEGHIGIPAYAVTEVGNKGVVLLSPSVSMTTTGLWQAWGLVRNDLPHNVGGVEVTVRLLAEDGKELDQLSTHTPVDPLRPGEPSPFHLHSSISASVVARAEWSVSAGDSNPLMSRRFGLGVSLRQEGKVIPETGSSKPIQMLVTVRNNGEAVADLWVTAAFVDSRTNRVIWVGTYPVDWTKWNRPLPFEGTANIEITIDDDPGRYRDQFNKDLSVMLWAVGRPAKS